MSEYNKLKKEFEKKVDELRKNCPHTSVSDWVDCEWAIGHSSGFLVKYCLRCELIVARKTQCFNCGKMMEEKDDDDKETHLAFLGHYCPKCQKEENKRWEDAISKTS